MRKGWLLLLLLLPVSALADGGIIPATAFPASVSIPDQRALLCWSNGIERLAIETRFVGEGTNFAWIVPLPTKPVIEEATTGIFSTLEYIFRPLIVHEVLPLYSILLFCVGVGYLLLYVRRNTEAQSLDFAVAALVGLAAMPLAPCLGLPLLLLLPYVVWRVRAGAEGLWAIPLVIIFGFILSAMLLPALGGVGVVVAAPGAVSVLSAQVVGAYDTTTVASKDPEALVRWLAENNFSLPRGADAVVSNYVKRGWVFVAARLHRNSVAKASALPHPLCFTFHSDTAVYPMQLTGIGNSNLQVELFVFGPSRAQAKYFETERCSVPTFAETGGAFGNSHNLVIAHPLVRKWAAGSGIATKLSAHLSAEQMNEDVELEWSPPREVHQTFYSNHGAAILGFNWGAGIFTACVVLGWLVIAIKRDYQPHLQIFVLSVALVSFVVATVIFVAAPKTEVRLVRLSGTRARMHVRNLEHSFSMLSETNSLDRIRSSLAEAAKEEPNLLLGGQIHEEDSPGNYVLRESTNGLEFIWYDGNGSEHTNE